MVKFLHDIHTHNEFYLYRYTYCHIMNNNKNLRLFNAFFLRKIYKLQGTSFL